MRESVPTAAVFAEQVAPAPGAGRERVASVDVLRGLVITLMIFVNDIAGALHAPAWLKHVGAEADAMTLPDVVFPAFLFIAGMSIPLALQPALQRGVTRAACLRRILGRTIALLIMGVVMVNHEEMNLGADASWWQRQWGFFAYLAMAATFMVVPTGPARARNGWHVVRLGGFVVLVGLVLAYRNGAGQPMVLGPLRGAGDAEWLHHSWWGILGLIGWAYLVAALAYLALGRRREWLVGATACLLLLYIAAASDLSGHLAARSWLGWAAPVVGALQAMIGFVDAHVSIGSTLGSLPAITMAGCCLGTILLADSDVRSPAARLRWALAFAAGLVLAGVLLDAPYGINKIRATPAWCCYCAALTTAAWAALYGVLDVRGWRGWSRVVAPAGANPLLAYLLHPFVYLVAGLGGSALGRVLGFYKSPNFPAIVAILGSLAMAVLVVQATGWIVRTGYRLKV